MRRESANGVSVSVSVFVRRERSLRRVEKKRRYSTNGHVWSACQVI
jgi:hypothetical protein